MTMEAVLHKEPGLVIAATDKGIQRGEWYGAAAVGGRYPVLFRVLEDAPGGSKVEFGFFGKPVRHNVQEPNKPAEKKTVMNVMGNIGTNPEEVREVLRERLERPKLARLLQNAHERIEYSPNGAGWELYRYHKTGMIPHVTIGKNYRHIHR